MTTMERELLPIDPEDNCPECGCWLMRPGYCKECAEEMEADMNDE